MPSAPTPTDFEVREVRYRARPMDARTAFHISRRVGALMIGFLNVQARGLEAVPLVLEALARMPDADLDYILDKSLATVSRLDGQSGKTPQPIFNNGRMQYEDIGMREQLEIVTQVIRPFVTDFFESLPNVMGVPTGSTTTAQGTESSSST